MDVTKNIISCLQDIQDNLVGLVLPVIITALVSLVTLVINTIMQIALQNGKYNSEQYTIMQEFYPKFKTHFLGLNVILQELKKIYPDIDLKNSIDKYLEFKSNEKEYRKNHAEEIMKIDTFSTVMSTLTKKLVDINNCLSTCRIPHPPIMHPILKIKTGKMLVVIRYYSFLFGEYDNGVIKEETLKAELTNLKTNRKVELDYNTVEKYISLLDKWLKKY